MFPETADSALGGFYEICGQLERRDASESGVRRGVPRRRRLEEARRARDPRPAGPRVDHLRTCTRAQRWTIRRRREPSWIRAGASGGERPSGVGGDARCVGVPVGHPDTGYTDSVELDKAAMDLERDRDFVTNDDDARDPMDPSEFPRVTARAPVR